MSEEATKKSPLGDAFATPARPWVKALSSDQIYLLSKVGNRATRLLGEALSPLSLRPREFAALQYLATNDGASQQELVSALWSDSSSVVSIVDEFEKNGLAERRRRPQDRRSYGVWLTTRGSEVLGQASQINSEVEEQLLHRLSGEQRAQLLQSLRLVVGVSPPSIGDSTEQ